MELATSDYQNNLPMSGGTMFPDVLEGGENDMDSVMNNFPPRNEKLTNKAEENENHNNNNNNNNNNTTSTNNNTQEEYNSTLATSTMNNKKNIPQDTTPTTEAKQVNNNTVDEGKEKNNGGNNTEIDDTSGVETAKRLFTTDVKCSSSSSDTSKQNSMSPSSDDRNDGRREFPCATSDDDTSAPMDFAETADNTVCLVAFKKRSGLGQFMRQGRNWQQRWIVLSGTRLSYYRLGEEDADEPRGMVDLLDSQATIQVPPRVTPGAPTQHQLDFSFAQQPAQTALHGNNDGTDPQNDPLNNLDHHPNIKPQVNQTWKFCFYSQSDQVRFLTVAHSILEKGGSFVEKDSDRFEHDLKPGDHVYRWEMLIVPPIAIYPIQIHGIVLEAGRNCVMVADFGLTGYRRKQGDTFNHAEDHEHDNKILAAFKKLNPKDNGQRLNLRALTDPREIRKWHKANYKDMATIMSQKHKKTKSRTKTKKTHTQGQGQLQKIKNLMTPHFHLDDELCDTTDNVNDTDNARSQSSSPNKSVTHLHSLESECSYAQDEILDVEQPTNESEDNHENVQSNRSNIRGTRGRAHTWDETTKIKARSSASSPQHGQQQQTQQIPLPKSDPVKIVLSRVVFLLEYSEQCLPPYHVFYSNSECIAVWCKTGRWSTLQAAVFLSSNSVGAAKTSTITTLGVAATHVFLAPVVAVGGLLWVTAPMVILQKSRKKWQEITQSMTDLFWQWAPNEVFVEAIQNWGQFLLNR